MLGIYKDCQAKEYDNWGNFEFMLSNYINSNYTPGNESANLSQVMKYQVRSLKKNMRPVDIDNIYDYMILEVVTELVVFTIGM